MRNGADEQETTGSEMFDAFCREMRVAYDRLERETGIRTGADAS